MSRFAVPEERDARSSGEVVGERSVFERRGLSVTSRWLVGCGVVSWVRYVLKRDLRYCGGKISLGFALIASKIGESLGVGL